MLIITKKIWSHVIDEDTAFIERLKKRLTIKDENDNSIELFKDKEGEEYLPFGCLDIPTGIVDTLVLPYVEFQGLKDERKDIDFDVSYLRNLVVKTYEEMAKASSGFEVRQHQLQGTLKCLINKHGICEAATGSGKTEIITSLLKILDGKILVINNRTNILNQIEGRARLRGLTKKIEYLNKNPDLESSEIIISTNNLIWNLVKKNDSKILKYLKSVKAIICDECHHGSCQSIATPAMIANPEYLIGFTASPYKENGLSFDDIMLNAVFGNSFYFISSKYLREKGFSSYIYSYYIDYMQKTVTKRMKNCADVYKIYIAENFQRNEIAFKIIKQVYDQGLKILVMVNRIEHGQNVLSNLKDLGIKSLFLCGGNKIYEALEETEKVKGITKHKILCKKGNADSIKKAIREENYKVIVGNVVFNEGIDVPEFDVGLLLDAGKNIISHVQRIGRICRRKENGINCAVFIDFNDKGHPYLERWTEERKNHLKKEGIPIISKEQFNTLIFKLGLSRK